MKLASLKLDSPENSSRDGELAIVSRDLQRVVRASHIAPSLREAVEKWEAVSPRLQSLYDSLNRGDQPDAFAYNEARFLSPLPRSFQWADGSAFLHHVKLVRMARKAPLPETLYEVPLMYQGGSDEFLAPTADIPQIDFEHGTDFEGEIAVVTNDVPMGVSAERALRHIVLVMLVNDVSLRGLIPAELAQGFGFFQSKPSSAFAPLALTLDELSTAWRDGRLHLPLDVSYNGAFFGCANGGEMFFHFGQLIAHAARTRNLGAGSIIGSGTISNEDETKGSSCLAERRMIEQIKFGEPKTQFMKVGDTVTISMRNERGEDLFGRIHQKVVQARVTQ